MKIPDTNLLIYGINEDAPKHRRARRWLRNALSGDEAVGIPWVVIVVFRFSRIEWIDPLADNL